jgi:hypothetical protein
MMSVPRSLAQGLLPDGGAQSMATMPLDARWPEAAKAVIGLFAQWV